MLHADLFFFVTTTLLPLFLELSLFLNTKKDDNSMIKVKHLKGLQTGQRQLLYPYETRMIFEAFGVGD